MFSTQRRETHRLSLCALSTSAFAFSSSSTVSVWPLSSAQSDALCSAVSLQTPNGEPLCSCIPRHHIASRPKYSLVQRQKSAHVLRPPVHRSSPGATQGLPDYQVVSPYPSSFLASTTASASRRALTHSSAPLLDATCNAVDLTTGNQRLIDHGTTATI
jgi:hypothetical protein